MISTSSLRTSSLSLRVCSFFKLAYCDCETSASATTQLAQVAGSLQVTRVASDWGTTSDSCLRRRHARQTPRAIDGPFFSGFTMSQPPRAEIGSIFNHLPIIRGPTANHQYKSLESCESMRNSYSANVMCGITYSALPRDRNPPRNASQPASNILPPETDCNDTAQTLVIRSLTLT